MNARDLPKVATLQRVNHGAHFRAHGLRNIAPELIDPFMGVDHAWISAPTFPPHPHAGFSAVTYMFLDSETAIANQDSLGNHNLIEPGGVHWTKAARGVVHEESPAITGRTAHLLQIFVNLEAGKQNDAPEAMGLEPHEVPVVQIPAGKIRVPLGHYGDVVSPLKAPTEVTLLDISLNEFADLSIPIQAHWNSFVMPIFGNVVINGEVFEGGGGTLPIIQSCPMNQAVSISAGTGGAKVVLFSGPPLRQPIYWYGPMAMASKSALASAIAAYQRGEFGML